MRGMDAIPELTFGKFLVEAGVLTARDLEEATQNLVLYGGRLGTSLVEAGVLTVPELEEQLAAYHGLQPVPAEWLERPDPAARAAIPAELVTRHSAFPLAFEKRTLHLGMLDPRNEAVIDEIAFASGCAIVPYAVPECRFALLMEKGFGARPNMRFANLMRQAESARKIRQRRATPESAPADDNVAGQEFHVEPFAAELDLVDERSFERDQQSVQPLASLGNATTSGLHQTRTDETWELGTDAGLSSEAAPSASAPEFATPSAAAPRPGPAEIARLEGRLLETPERGEVIRSAVGIASGFAELAALFVVRNQIITGVGGWRDGEWIDVESILLPLAEESSLAEAAKERRVVRGAPQGALDQRLARALGREDVREFVAIPIQLGDRVVNVLLVDGASAAVSRAAMSALGQLVPMLSGAYERLILAQKQSGG